MSVCGECIWRVCVRRVFPFLGQNLGFSLIFFYSKLKFILFKCFASKSRALCKPIFASCFLEVEPKMQEMSDPG